jgi:hypothetical protein
MNNTSKSIYAHQRKMNDNTRTAIVYTSDLTNRNRMTPSTAAQKTRSTAHSVISQMQTKQMLEDDDKISYVEN